MNLPKTALILWTRNAENRIQDWILYHAFEGIDIFFVMDDRSDDGTVAKLKEIRSKYNIDIRIEKDSDDIGNRYDPNTTHTDRYSRDKSCFHRGWRMITRGIQELIKINPDCICGALDIDEFLVSNKEQKIANTLIEIFSRNIAPCLFVFNFDVSPTIEPYTLEDWYITSEKTRFRWDFKAMQNNYPYKYRCKSFWVAGSKSYLDDAHKAYSSSQLQQMGVDEVLCHPDPFTPVDIVAKGASISSHEILRMHHFRNPELAKGKIKKTVDYTLINRALNARQYFEAQQKGMDLW